MVTKKTKMTKEKVGNVHFAHIANICSIAMKVMHVNVFTRSGTDQQVMQVRRSRRENTLCIAIRDTLIFTNFNNQTTHQSN